MSRRRRTVVLAVNVTAIAALGGLAVRSAAGSGEGSTPTPRRHVVEIRALAFHPPALTVSLGDTVVWINRDIFPHTATATGAGAWDTGTLAAGASGPLVVRAKGVAPYLCTLHPSMRGTLEVR